MDSSEESDKKWIQDPINSLIYLIILEIVDQKVTYGYEIKQLIEKQINESLQGDNVTINYELKFSSLYTILRKLENKFELIKTVDCESSSNSKEKSRRCYTLTKKGKDELLEIKSEWILFYSMLKRLFNMGYISYE